MQNARRKDKVEGGPKRISGRKRKERKIYPEKYILKNRKEYKSPLVRKKAEERERLLDEVNEDWSHRTFWKAVNRGKKKREAIE